MKALLIASIAMLPLAAQAKQWHPIRVTVVEQALLCKAHGDVVVAGRTGQPFGHDCGRLAHDTPALQVAPMGEEGVVRVQNASGEQWWTLASSIER